MSGPGKGYGDNLTHEIFDMTHSIILVCCSVLQSVAMCCNVSSVRCGDNEDHFALKCSKKRLRIAYINVHICTCVHLNTYFCANVRPGKDDEDHFSTHGLAREILQVLYVRRDSFIHVP